VIANLQTSLNEFGALLQRVGVERRWAQLIGFSSLLEPNLTATLLTKDEGGGAVDKTSGYLSLANFAEQQAIDILWHSTEFDVPANWVNLALKSRLRPRDALLLPLHLPLFGGEADLAKESGATPQSYSEELVFAGAELLRREYANGKITLQFYVTEPTFAV